MGERKIKKIKYSRRFLKSLECLPDKIINQAQGKEEIFKENPFHSSLRTHKLSGKDRESWAFWVDYSYRIKFVFLSDEEVLFLDIGMHEIYQ